MKFNNIKLLTSALVIIATFLSASAFIQASEAHILVIGDSLSDFNYSYYAATDISDALKSKNYSVVELLRENATQKNILKGMYGADAVIYIGHGSYEYGNYHMNGGNATPPFGIAGSDGNIMGMGNKMYEEWNGNLFTAPFKKNIPVIIMQACFSTGWVEYKEVANPIQTVYNFAKMFTGAGANYYATGLGPDIVYKFLDGAVNFADADNKTYEPIKNSTFINGTQIWRNPDGKSVFIGNWSSKFPTAAQTTHYNNTAAETWYKTNVMREKIDANFIITDPPFYVNQTIWFVDYSNVINGVITNYIWNFGDGKTISSTATTISSHKYTKSGTYTIKYTVIDKNTKKTSSISKNITIINPKQDLVITKAYKSGNYLYVTVKNQGKTNSGACYTLAWYSRYYKNIYTYGLKAGSYKTYKVYFKYRHGTVKTDYYNDIAELNENNNGKSF